MFEQESIIPQFLTLISIDTFIQDFTGNHTWTFIINDPNSINLSQRKTLVEELKSYFPYDSEACLDYAPKINSWEGTFTVTIPFSC